MVFCLGLADHSELVRHGLASMLRGHNWSVEMLDRSSGTVDIALCEVVAANGTAADVVSRLRADPRVRKVVVYTWNFQAWAAGDCISSGASGYLDKSLPSGSLVAALDAIHTGRVVVAPGSIAPTRTDGHGLKVELTVREAQVVSLIAAGFSIAEVAAHMVLSVNSVKTYIRSAYAKIGVSRRSQAVLWAVAHGLASKPTPPPSQLDAVGC